MAVLVLEDGSVFHGRAFGFLHRVVGEVVFNTGMTGYQEVLTDPSYCGQIVTMTYPLIGNYGINDMDGESETPKVKGFIVRELAKEPSNWMAQKDLNSYLYENKIMAVEGLDTRALTRKIREKGTMMGMLSPDMPSLDEIRGLGDYKLHRPVEMVTTAETYTLLGEGPHIAVLDFGLKKNILRSLQRRKCRITVFPAKTSAAEVLSINPDGILLTNGPGDPKENPEAIDTIRNLIGTKPIFGICLGHQLLALASGADTHKLKYGHRGCNHPVKDVLKDRTYITSQNHGYTIIEESMDLEKIAVSHRNLNDGTIEGIRFKDCPVFSVQFHPEAAPGPQDTGYLFEEFLGML